MRTIQGFLGGGRPLKRQGLGLGVFCNNFKSKPKKSARKAFSIAEAMVTLLIVSIALAAAAPIMSRSIKNTATVNPTPAGVVVFSKKPCDSLDGGWKDVPNDWKGRYPRIAGTVVCQTGERDCTADSYTYGEKLGDAIRNIKGGADLEGTQGVGAQYGAYNVNYGLTSTEENAVVDDSGDAVSYTNDGGKISFSSKDTPDNKIRYIDMGQGIQFAWTFPSQPSRFDFNANLVVPTANENRPKTVVLYMCEKL